MSSIIFITKSIDAKCIAEGFTNTSSAAFEYGLVIALKKKSDLLVIYLGFNDTNQKGVNGLRYCSINYSSVFGFLRLAKVIFHNRNANDLNILTTGYYPVEIAVVIFLAKIFRLKSFGYVYDTHQQATAKLKSVKKVLANIYFDFGFYLVKKHSGLLVLNDSFIKKNRITVPYLKTKIGVNYWSTDEFHDADRARLYKKKRKVIVFAGTINRENGADLLIDFVKSNKDVQFELHFYGSGEGAPAVQELAKVDCRVKYFGRISDKLLHQKLVEADFLINLRDPVGLSVDYSYPSKLIKFMSTGTPVISNRFPGLDDCCAVYLHLIDNYERESIFFKIISLLENNSNKDFGIDAKEFICIENDWNKIVEQVTEFIKKS